MHCNDVTAPGITAQNTRTVYPFRALNELSIQQTAMPSQPHGTPVCLAVYGYAYRMMDHTSGLTSPLSLI